jgi:hypothetical protein
MAGPVVASSVLVAWLYTSPARNLLAALLWQAMNTVAFALFPTIDLVPGADPRGFVLQATLYVLAAAIVVATWCPRTLTSRAESAGPPDLMPTVA